MSDFMTVPTVGTRNEVVFPSAHVNIGVGNANQGTQQSYLYINGFGAGCDAFPRQVTPNTLNLCPGGATQYATFVQGIYINGLMSEAKGRTAMFTRTGGTASGTETDLALVDTPGQTFGPLNNINLGRVSTNNGQVSYFCCNK